MDQDDKSHIPDPIEENDEQRDSGSQAQDVADDARVRSTDLSEDSERGGKPNPAQIIPDDTPDLVERMEAAGPYGMGWPAPRLATGPVRIVRCDVVGTTHVRAIAAGDDGASFKAMAFRSVDTPLGQALLGAPRDRRFWLAGRVKIDNWNGNHATEMHVDDLAPVEF